MIDIYNEMGYIKNILSNGLSQKWERDAILLTRFFKMEGFKKNEVKDKIREHCERASNRSEDPIYFNRLISYKRLNSIIDGAWKKEVPLREIQYIEISKEVLDWFLNLEKNFYIDDEMVKKEKIKRPGVKISNYPINWERTKYLFTLYVWTKVQENYLDKPNMHYLKQYNKRFKEDAGLKQSFSLQKERDFLYDIGLIDINYAIGINVKFIKDYEVFKIPITDDNRIRIYSEDPPDGELYHPGYWLEMKKNGSFICEKCGKEVALKKKPKGGRPQKYCDKCSGNGIGDNCRSIICIDCGRVVEVNNKDHKTKRCFQCQKEHIKAYDRERKNKEFQFIKGLENTEIKSGV